jgi:hypothetical protein
MRRMEKEKYSSSEVNRDVSEELGITDVNVPNK